MAASDLPVLVDGDNGYGDVKTIVHVVNFHEGLGAHHFRLFRSRALPIPRRARGAPFSTFSLKGVT
jgi:hypothetical protein